MNQDSFFTYWLILPLIGIALFVASEAGRFVREGAEESNTFLRRFAFRFSAIYWVLYLLPAPLTMMIHGEWNIISEPFTKLTNSGVKWVATNVLKLQSDLPLSAGSGDTTGDYIRVLAIFALAIGGSLIWAVAVRRPSSDKAADLLRVFIRYSLAFTLVIYGLAKLFPFTNQFPEPTITRLMQPYGESSPMGILWTFMGASKPYSVASGIAELLGAVLLLSRRTATLGALFSAGVMMNVVMLNFFYDVPVKLYSSHLLLAAVFIALADSERLKAFFFKNREAGSAPIDSPVFSNWSRPLVGTAKVIVITLGLFVPFYLSAKNNSFAAKVDASKPDWYGVYDVESITVDGQPASEDFGWSRFTMMRLPYTFSMEDGLEWVANDRFSIQAGEAGSAGVALFDEETLELELQGNTPDLFSVETDGDRGLVLTGDSDGKEMVVTLKQLKREDFLLVNRGFHWINEFPYNR